LAVGVTYGRILGNLGAAALEGYEMTLALESLRSDQTLDFRSFGVWLLAFALRYDCTSDDKFADLSIIDVSLMPCIQR
jgi:hypothetical protein